MQAGKGELFNIYYLGTKILNSKIIYLLDCDK